MSYVGTTRNCGACSPRRSIPLSLFRRGRNSCVVVCDIENRSSLSYQMLHVSRTSLPARRSGKRRNKASSTSSASAGSWGSSREGQSGRQTSSVARLNGVAFGGGRWLVVAESGEALFSVDAFTWTKLQPSSDRLRGLTCVYGQFIITGTTASCELRSTLSITMQNCSRNGCSLETA